MRLHVESTCQAGGGGGDGEGGGGALIIESLGVPCLYRVRFPAIVLFRDPSDSAVAWREEKESVNIVNILG